MHTKISSVSLFLICLLLAKSNIVLGSFDPCSGKAQYGGVCDRDSDCVGFGVICSQGKCQCDGNYAEKTDKDGSKYCAKLPDTINSNCLDGACRYPMFCEGGKCKCIRATTDGNQCFASMKVGDSCTKSADCTVPFSACLGGKCSCIAGTTQSGAGCSAASNCPTGSPVKGNCIRTSSNVAYIQNFPNSGGKVDNCPASYYCYTTDLSNYGVCCPQTCPLGSTPETKFSCDPTATVNRCNESTHYCHRAAGQSYSSTVCCRRPCREPNPVYIKGQCFPRAYLGSPCQSNEHCDGGYAMVCSNGRCNCNSGFKAYSDSYTTGDNPAQTCVRDCGARISKSGECFTASALQQSCTVNDQCPSGAACFRGMCFCDCRKGLVKSGSTCAPAPKGTGTGTGTGTNGQPRGTGTAVTQKSIIDIFKGILQPQGGG